MSEFKITSTSIHCVNKVSDATTKLFDVILQDKYVYYLCEGI